MLCTAVRYHPVARTLVVLALPAFLVFVVSPGVSLAQATDTDSPAVTPEQFALLEEARQLRSTGQIDEAIARLETIIKQYADNDALIREAYHNLVSISLGEKQDPGQAAAYARDGLTHFPDLRAETIYHPKSVNDLYDRLRSEMFGSLSIDEPKGADVYLTSTGMKEAHYGRVPQAIPYLPVGDYKIRLAQSGYEDVSDDITIVPGTPLARAYQMKKTKGAMWWVYRVGAGVVAVGALAIALAGGGGDNPPPEVKPLPGPPDPPASSTND